MEDSIQISLLREVSVRANLYSCIAGLHVFGSFALGSHRRDSDIDLFVIYEGNRGTAEFVSSYTNWQEESEDWANTISDKYGHKVHIHNGHLSDPPDAAFSAIIAALDRPIFTIGKSSLLATPPRQNPN